MMMETAFVGLFKPSVEERLKKQYRREKIVTTEDYESEYDTGLEHIKKAPWFDKGELHYNHFNKELNHSQNNESRSLGLLIRGGTLILRKHFDIDPNIKNQREYEPHTLPDLHKKIVKENIGSPLLTYQREALKKYCVDSSRLNHALIKKHHSVPLTFREEDSLNDDNRNSISDIIKTREPLGGDLRLHSGIGFDPQHMLPEESNIQAFHLPAYTSLTVDPIIAHAFAKSRQTASYRDSMDHLLDIAFSPYRRHDICNAVTLHVPRGSRVFSTHDDNDFATEKELILNKNAKIAIHKKPIVIHKHMYTLYRNIDPDPRLTLETVTTHWYHGVVLHDGFNPTRFAENFKD